MSATKKPKSQPPTVISFYTNKGGTGKTTNCYGLGRALAKAGHSVLMVDLDPQMSLSYLATKGLQNGTDWAEFVEDKFTIMDALDMMTWRWTKGEKLSDNLDLLFGSENMSTLEEIIAVAFMMISAPKIGHNFVDDATMMSKFLQFVRTLSYDYVLMDLSASWTALNRNVICGSDYWIMPLLPDEFSRQALRTTLRRMDVNANQTRFGEKLLFVEYDEFTKNLKQFGVSQEKCKVKLLGYVLNKAKSGPILDFSCEHLATFNDEELESGTSALLKRILDLRT